MRALELLLLGLAFPFSSTSARSGSAAASWGGRQVKAASSFHVRGQVWCLMQVWYWTTGPVEQFVGEGDGLAPGRCAAPNWGEGEGEVFVGKGRGRCAAGRRATEA